jgi:hypothetical protein
MHQTHAVSVIPGWEGPRAGRVHLLDVGGNLPVRLHMQWHGWRPCGHYPRLAFRPWANATAAIDAPGSRHSLSTRAFNSALCFLRIGFCSFMVSTSQFTWTPSSRTKQAHSRGDGWSLTLSRVLPLLDWVALDIKAAPPQLPALTGAPGSVRETARALQLVQQSGVAYELRTTWHPRWLPEPALLMLADWLASHGVQRWVLQAGRPPGGGPAAALAASWREALKARVPQLSFR